MYQYCSPSRPSSVLSVFDLGDLLLSSVEADSATILQTTSYLFQVQRFGDVDPIPANSVVKIYFPNSYSTSGVSSCSPVDWTGDPSLLCSMTNQILSVGGGFSADSLIDSFSIRATGITNPFPAKEYSFFSIRIIYPDNT